METIYREDGKWFNYAGDLQKYQFYWMYTLIQNKWEGPYIIFVVDVDTTGAEWLITAKIDKYQNEYMTYCSTRSESSNHYSTFKFMGPLRKPRRTF